MGWLENLMPNEKQWQDFRESLMTIKSNMADKIEIGKQSEYITRSNLRKCEAKQSGLTICDKKNLTNANRSTYKAVWGN